MFIEPLLVTRQGSGSTVEHVSLRDGSWCAGHAHWVSRLLQAALGCSAASSASLWFALKLSTQALGGREAALPPDPRADELGDESISIPSWDEGAPGEGEGEREKPKLSAP